MKTPAGWTRRRLLAHASATALGAPVMTSAWAQTPYPQRPVRLIIPNAPGSSVDTIGRLFANQLAAPLGQPLVVDNRAGAAGAVGIEAGRNAAADGYTLIAASSSSITVAPLLQKAISYEPLRDFEFVSLIAVLPNVLVCHPGVPAQDLAGFFAHAKAQGGKFNMASAGPGSVSHLAGVALCHAAGFEALHVPYKGGSQSVGSVVAGETQWTLTPAPAAMGLVKGGRLRALGHSMARGTQPLGEIPSIAQTVAGFEFVSWIGLLAPRGLPAALGDQIRKATATVLAEASLRDGFALHGAVPQASSAEGFREFLVRDIDINRRAIRAAGVQPE